jgi:subtilase family serine protease
MHAYRKIAAVVACAALGLTGAAAAASPSGAQAVPSGGPAVRLTADQAPRLPAGTVALGRVAASQRLRLDVNLRLRDPAALTAFLAGLGNRRSPDYHRFLRPGQFGPRFGPALASVAAVEAALRQAGLTPGPVTSNRLTIPVSAPAGAVERALGVTLTRYRLPGGRVAYANTAAPRLPAAAASSVAGILGLNDVYLDQRALARLAPERAATRPVAAGGGRELSGHPMARASATGPQPCSAATTTSEEFGGYTADTLAQYYLMSPLYTKGDLGSGVRVALFEQEPNWKGDISAYESCYGVTTSVSYTKVDGGAGSGAGEGEAALDIEDVLGLAPAAALDVYQGPNGGDSDTYDIYNKIITADKDQVISTSWGECEPDSDATLRSAEQTLFEQANAQDQTVFAAAGDTGSTGCLREGGSNAGALATLDPATQPYVNGVGGTTVSEFGESVWNESAFGEGAGGGGRSADWCMPAYQYQTKVPGLISSKSLKNSGCPTATDGQYVAENPDISADADPSTGYVVYYHGSWTVIGGTSAAAPLWAAVAALIDDSPFCQDYGSGHPGVLPQGLWNVASVDHAYIYSGGKDEPEIVADITDGNNDYTPSGYTGGLYPATTGYDMASGLGSPLVSGVGAGGVVSWFYPGLAATMCEAYATKLKSSKVTAISPKTGSTAGGTKVTVTGSGFLPIGGADKAEIGTSTTLISATCTSTTTCTVVMPKHAAGTVDIRMIAEDFGFSPVTSADKFTYKS